MNIHNPALWLAVGAFTAAAAIFYMVRSRRTRVTMGGKSMPDFYSAPPEKTAPQPDSPSIVTLSAFCPAAIQKGYPFALDVWVYVESDRESVLELANRGGVKTESASRPLHDVPIGASIAIRLAPLYLQTVPGNVWKKRVPIMKSITWKGRADVISFPVMVSPTLELPRIQERLEVFVNGIFIGDLYVDLDFEHRVLINSRFAKVRSAFASYSSEDRLEVLGRIGMLTQLFNIDVFLDIEKLRGGDDFEERLMAEVVSRDKLLLFWSDHAAKSSWVNREWRLAFQTHGISFIEPVPLRPTQPPRELKALQFKDRYSILADYAERVERGPKTG